MSPKPKSPKPKRSPRVKGLSLAPVTQAGRVTIESPAAKLVTNEAKRRAEFEKLEDANYQKALEAIQGVVRFGDVSEFENDPPEEWVQEFGIKTAKRMLNYAKMAHMTRKDAPIGMTLLADVVKTERRARAAKNQDAPKELNIAVISMPLPSTMYDIIDVDQEDD